MRRVLILAYYFPPIAASGSMRPAGFCAHLPSLDYEPLVLRADHQDAHPALAIDDSLRDLVSEDLRVETVNYINWQRRILDIRASFRGALKTARVEASGEGESKNDDERDNRFSLKSEILNRIFRFPDQQCGWARAARGYAKTLDRDERPDIVFATANPWSSLLAGAEIASHFNVPFVADFRDPWVNNPKPPLTPSLGRKALKIERNIVNRATRVIANTHELAESFRARYPAEQNKFTAITNGFHQSLLDTYDRLPSYEASENKVELCYFGSVYELRKPTLLLQSVKELLDKKLPHSERISLRFTGNWIVADRHCNDLAEELEKRGALKREKSIDHSDYLAKLKSSQILLILQQDFPLQIPAKIYEYMASGRPCMVIGGNGATANLVNRTAIGRVCENSKQEIKQLLSTLCQSPDAIPMPEPSITRQYSYANLTKELVSCLDAAIAEYHE